MVLGTFEGVGGVVASETGVGAVIGYMVLMNGVDNAIAGAKQMWTGQNEKTLLNQGISSGSEALGTSTETAQDIADYGELAITLGLNVGNAKMMNLSAFPKKTYTVDPNKFNYFFGRVTTGSVHNIDRSAQNLKDLTTLGIKNEKQLMKVFDKALEKGTILSTRSDKFGTSVMRSVQIGNKGQINVSFFMKREI